jgi:hypothetical protein
VWPVVTFSSLLLPLRQHNLQVAAALGAACTAALVVVQWRWRRLRAVAAGGVLALVAAGEVVGTGNAPSSLVAALACLAAGGGVKVLFTGRYGGVPVATVAGASAVLAFGPGMNVPGPLWVRLTVAAATSVATAAIWSLERRWARLTLPLLLVTTAGIYACSPDTEQILILLGATVGVTAAGWWWGRGLGPLATPAVAGLLVWTVAVGGRGRHSSIIGGLGCLGLLVAAPLAARLARRSPGDGTVGRLWPWPAVGAVALQLVVVAASARGGGLRPSTRDAIAVVVPLLAAATAVVAASIRSTAPGDGSTPPRSPPADRSGRHR